MESFSPAFSYSFLIALRAIITLLLTMADSTINPPTKAHGPGSSPITRNTQTGFSTGSITGIKVASRAVTCLIVEA